MVINNFRSFGECQAINFNNQTALIGNNSSGKTTVLQALSKLFSDKQSDRIIRKSDFHLPKGLRLGENTRNLFIETIFEFDELDGTVYGPAIPTFFEHFTVSQDGAKPDIFPDYILDFNSNEYQLLMNHRSVPELVEFQKEVHQILNSNHSSIQTNNYPEFQEGEITLFKFENENLEAELIANDIESKIQGGIRPSEICILAKQKVDDYSSKLITTLSSKGIKARIENEYQELLKAPTCNLLLDLISCSQGKRDPLIWENISNFYGNINGIDEFTDELILAKSYKEIDNIVSDITYLISNFIPNEESMLKLIDCIIEKIDEKELFPTFQHTMEKVT